MGVPIDIALPGQTQLDTLAIPLAQPLELGELGGLTEGARRQRRVPGRPRRGAHRPRAIAARTILVGLGQRARRRSRRLPHRRRSRRTGARPRRRHARLAARREPSDRAGRPGAGARRGNRPRRLHAGPLEDAGHREASAAASSASSSPTPRRRSCARRPSAQRLLAERTNRARDLANMPPNELNPTRSASTRRRSRASSTI